MSKDSVDDYLSTTIAMDMPIVLYPEMAKEIQSLIESAPCPICRTNCSGCLEDLAAKQEGLRELRSYCVVQEEAMLSHFNPPSASGVFGEIATKLGELLDGES